MAGRAEERRQYEAAGRAISGSRVGLYGGYGPHGPMSGRLAAGHLDGDRLTLTGEFRLVLPDGQDLPAVRPIARGPTLHFLTGADRYQLSIHDVPAGVRG